MTTELRHLAVFVAIAEECSFCYAAKRLMIAQSAVSRTIRDLERDATWAAASSNARPAADPRLVGGHAGRDAQDLLPYLRDRPPARDGCGHPVGGTTRLVQYLVPVPEQVGDLVVSVEHDRLLEHRDVRRQFGQRVPDHVAPGRAGQGRAGPASCRHHTLYVSIRMTFTPIHCQATFAGSPRY
jgi:hypothetical protein